MHKKLSTADIPSPPEARGLSMSNVIAGLIRSALKSIRTLYTYSTDRLVKDRPARRPGQQDRESLTASFNKRYRHFRSLLTANNNALQAMAELEKLYYSGESYRMSQVRSKITAILVNVYKMIRNLREMSSGKYSELESRFEIISDEIDTIVEGKKSPEPGPLILPLSQVSRMVRQQTGDKMANLGEISNIPSITVPHGFVITASATNHFITPHHLAEINRKLQILETDSLEGLYRTCTELQQMILELPLPADLEELLHEHYSTLENSSYPGCLVALRSSAQGEDTAGVSFAGLYTTVLDVDRDHLGDTYKRIIAGKYSPRAISYRQRRGFRHEDIEMCVGCLVMVDAQVSGVAYSRCPLDPERQTVRIIATPGRAKGVVDGTAISTTYLVTREKPHRQTDVQEHTSGEGVRILHGTQLPPSQVQEIAGTAMILEDHFKCPQDIEWSFDQQGTLHILQSRPILLNTEETHGNAKQPDVPSGSNAAAAIIEGGICAGRGIASGKVFKVFTDEDVQHFPPGGVLVVEYPIPDWAPLLSRASAILSENGTEAGHLATVAREFRIPALFSLSGIMEKLENGRMVTVDSGARKLFAGCRNDLLVKKGPRRDLMAGSPVQRILTEALQQITPLNLNDPASHVFRAARCETLHDLTRYCHEKSVTEMFSFGEKINFDQGKAKRLVADVPLEWWVINLADGFRPDVEDDRKTVAISDIVSDPMLAIWKGISAFPWQGPPPITPRGFGSIILQSAMRPELDPAVATRLTVKNYFLISKNFCNLNVRLGYHYAMIESYVSDFLTESYISFRFKGGAADMKRRAVRAKLLADILQEFEFGVELRLDSLLARVKKRQRDYLAERLQILGYLTLHTRQLDMVMDRQDSVTWYKNKFLREINEMLSSKTAASAGAIHEQET